MRSSCRKNRLGVFGLAYLICIGSTSPLASAESIQIVVHKSNPIGELSEEELSRYFLKKSTEWGHGVKIWPVDLAPSNTVRAIFSQTVHRRSVPAIKSYWEKMIFSGKATPPVEVASDRAVIDFVRSNVGGIGYVSQGAIVGLGIKTVRIVP